MDDGTPEGQSGERLLLVTLLLSSPRARSAALGRDYFGPLYRVRHWYRTRRWSFGGAINNLVINPDSTHRLNFFDSLHSPHFQAEGHEMRIKLVIHRAVVDAFH